ncbi:MULTISPECIES: hypothetical protein [unclassified Streptomyces]|uniref:hypothetical protein n=1 Tax=unclassified Streptomyces TaxID=2593676 RepID=UPI00278C7CD6|nr:MULTISPECIES: hypothetical protein [unclassified Streptomyces]
MRGAGGWLFDRAAAGWDATALVVRRGDERALRILGAHAADLAAAPVASAPGPGRLAVAVEAGLYATDERVRHLVARTRESGLADIRFWGATTTTDLGDGGGPAHHRLSVAARAFKRRALDAVAPGASEPVGAEEFFRRGGALRADQGPAAVARSVR